jgi:hypothetical protein
MKRKRWTIRLGAWIAMSAAGVVLPLASSAETSGTLTTADGSVAVAGKAAEIHAPVSDGESVVTGPESNCSVLVEQSSLVQFCGQAAVRIRHDLSRNATLLDVERGGTRAVIGKRSPDAPLEIRTPIAIAEIRGTVIRVHVDPATGDSTFLLEEGEVSIASRQGGARPITLRAGEEVTIRAGKPPGKVRRFRPEDLEKASTCPHDASYHQMALQLDRSGEETQAIDEIVAADVDEANLPPVGGGPPGGPAPPPPTAFDPVPPGTGPATCFGVCSGYNPAPAPTAGSSPTLSPPGPVSFPSEIGHF